MTLFSRYILLLLLITAILSPAFQYSASYGGILLKVQNLAVSKKTPARFLLSLEPNEDLHFNFLVRGKKENISIRIINLSEGERVVNIINAGNADKPVLIGRRGEYALEVRSEAGGSDFVDLTVSSGLEHKNPDHKPIRALKMTSCYVEKKDEIKGQPKFFLYLKKGDHIVVSSTAADAAQVKMSFVQKGERFAINAGKEIAIETDGEYSFGLYSEKKGSGFLGIGTKMQEAVLEDLLITRVPFSPIAAETAKSLAGSTSGKDGNTGAADDKTKGMESALSDLGAALAQLSKKDSTYEVVSTNVVEIDTLVGPALNPLDSNCMCLPLRDINFGNPVPELWVYQIATGNNKAFFLEFNKKANGARGVLWLYAKGLYNANDKNMRLPQILPSGRVLPAPEESIEYAIVDEANVAAFHQGEYARYHELGNRFTFLDFGNAEIPPFVPYLCLRNPNKLTPVRVYFKYESFGRQLNPF